MSLFTDEFIEAYRSWNGILPAPSARARKTPKGIRICNNNFLEYTLTRVHPVVPGLWVLPLVAYLIFEGLNYHSVQMTAVLVFAGFLSWTLLEYVIHYYLFHKEVTPKTPKAFRFVLFMLHGYHHEYPADPSRLVMPISIAWPLGIIVGGGIWATLGVAQFFGFFSGILLGYLGYDWIHYSEHHFRPKTRLGRYIHGLHTIHHYIDQNANFGISTPIWDFVFGKVREPGAKKLSQSVAQSSTVEASNPPSGGRI